MSGSNYIQKVAVVGAGGNSGSFITEALLKTQKHTVTALSRADSKNKLPAGVLVKHVDYEKPETLVEALRGQDALVITLSTSASPQTQTTLVDAAVEAGVKWVFPNHWGPDTEHPGLAKDVSFFGKIAEFQKKIVDQGKVNLISVSTGFWYEWSLAIPASYGFDIAKRQVTLFDEGKTKISTSTWPQVGRAVAAILSLPLHADGSSKGLEDFKNKLVYVNSFTLSQEDMLESLLRVTDTKRQDWTITKQPSRERYDEAIKAGAAGDRGAYVYVMYTRVFFPDGSGDFESGRGTLNSLLGLPKEDLDEATKVAVERAAAGKFGYDKAK